MLGTSARFCGVMISAPVPVFGCGKCPGPLKISISAGALAFVLHLHALQLPPQWQIRSDNLSSGEQQPQYRTKRRVVGMSHLTRSKYLSQPRSFASQKHLQPLPPRTGNHPRGAARRVDSLIRRNRSLRDHHQFRNPKIARKSSEVYLAQRTMW